MVGTVTKEQAICYAQHLDLIYSQSSMLYDLILNSHQPSTNGSHSKLGPHVDGVIGSTSTAVVGMLDGNLGQMTISKNPSSIVHVPNPSPATSQTSKVHTVQTTSSKKPRGKRKTKENPRSLLLSKVVRNPNNPLLRDPRIIANSSTLV